MKVKLLHKLRRQGFKTSQFDFGCYLTRIDMDQVDRFYHHNLVRYIPDMFFHVHWHEHPEFRRAIREKYGKYSINHKVKY